MPSFWDSLLHQYRDGQMGLCLSDSAEGPVSETGAPRPPRDYIAEFANAKVVDSCSMTPEQRFKYYLRIASAPP